MSSTTHHRRSDHSSGDGRIEPEGTRRTRSHESVDLYDPDDCRGTDSCHAVPDHRISERRQVIRSDEKTRARPGAQSTDPATRKQYNDHGAVRGSIVRNGAHRVDSVAIRSQTVEEKLCNRDWNKRKNKLPPIYNSETRRLGGTGSLDRERRVYTTIARRIIRKSKMIATAGTGDSTRSRSGRPHS